jgi:hypothetical protein
MLCDQSVSTRFYATPINAKEHFSQWNESRGDTTLSSEMAFPELEVLEHLLTTRD